MGKFIDETGKKYERLTVLYKTPNIEKGKPIKWHCVCDCGVELDVLGSSLRNGNTKSCGCLQRDKAIESNIKRGKQINEGDLFGDLKIIERLPKKSKERTKYLCECSCGNRLTIGRDELIKKQDHRCQECNSKIASEKIVIREEGNKYGKLTVIEEAGRDKDRRVLWRCLCDCGNEKIALGKSLRAGFVQSCGCLHSKGEMKIALLLKELNIDFISQYHTEELKSENGHYLYFDFYLPTHNIIIEYQGEQHYQHIHSWYDEKGFKKLQERDEQKRIFCKSKNIKIIEIPYTDFNKIDKDYIRRVMQ